MSNSTCSEAMRPFDQKILGAASDLYNSQMRPILQVTPPALTLPFVPSIRPRLNVSERDPEKFYYAAGWLENEAVQSGSLTCDLFRHCGEDEIFIVDVVFPDDGNARGAVRVIVEAENLAKPETIQIDVSRKVTELSLVELAEKMVEDSRR